jgi:Immunity protein Imm1
MEYLCGPNDADRRELSNPSWSDIEMAIRQLNGVDRTLVLFGSGTPVPHMAIGGGREGKYIVYTTYDNTTFYTMVGTDRSEGKVVFVAGGQLGDYPIRNCVTLERALRAAQVFAEEGRVDLNFEWDTR